VTNPATGEVISTVADCGASEARRAIEAADAARAEWAARPAGERAKLLRRWRDLMVAWADDLAALLTAEMGKPLAEAKGEILYGASYLEWFAEEAKRIYGDVIPSASPENRIVVIKQPVGVCAVITPWNFPNAMLMRKAAAALAAGCTLVSKPAEDTPLSALAIAELAAEAEIPAGVFNVVPSSNPAEVGGEFTSNPLVRKISFTGSTEVGKLLIEQSASTLKKVSMELGGNAPFIIFDDADLDAAIPGLMASKYRNAGQTCVCANRILVHNKIMDEVAKRLAEEVNALKVAPGDTEGSEIGPLINEEALAKTERLVASAVDAGAKVVTGGVRHNAGALFYTPTVLKGARGDMDIAREEIFGPVAPLIGFDTEDEAVAMANDTPYGLASYFYTRDLGRAWRVAEALEYGMVGVNEGIVSSAVAPFGGVKHSGMGREGSKYGLEDYLEIKYMLMGGLGR
jgi:succinate-semialdehyde dehydrogenase/glutarate-semialdehyde dehydrogenase